jgi:hypothetical protein
MISFLLLGCCVSLLFVATYLFFCFCAVVIGETVSLAHMIQATICSEETNVLNKYSSKVGVQINGGTNPCLFSIMYNRSYHVWFSCFAFSMCIMLVRREIGLHGFK